MYGYCQGCKQFAVLRLVDSWRYRCNNCIAADALARPDVPSEES
jgi:hypothetical protein